MSVDRFTSLGEDDRVRALLDLGSAPPADFGEIRNLVLAGLADESWRVRKAAKEVIEKYPPPIFVGDLLDALAEIGRPGLRNAAVEILSTHLGEALAPITERFSGADAEVRKFMVDIVGGSRGPEGMGFLISALTDPDPNVASAAAEFLGHHEDSRAVAALMAVIRSAGGWIAFPAVESLGRIGSEDALPLLTQFAADSVLREAAIEAIGNIGGDGAVPVLVEAFSKGRRRLKETALKGIGRLLTGRARCAATPAGIGDLASALAAPLAEQEGLLHELVSHPDEAVAEAAQTLLLAVGGRDSFLRIIRGIPAEESDRIVALLGGLPVDLSAMLAGELTSGDPLARLIALRALLVRGDFPGGVEASLEKLLADEQGHVRGDAAIALARVGRGDGWRGILGLLRDPYPDVRDKAVAALLDIGTARPDLAEPIARAVLDGMSAGGISPVAGIGIAARLQPDDPGIGKVAADLLADSEPAVRKAALAALALTARGRADDDLFFQMMADEDPSVRLAALKGVLARGREPDFPRLLLLVSDPSVDVAAEAARFIGERAPADVVEKLWSSVEKAPGLVRLRTVEGLAANQGFRRVRFFRDLLNGDDPEIVRLALGAVAAIGGKEELPTILAALEHPDWRVRLEAVSAAAGVGGRTAMPLLAARGRRETDATVAERIAKMLAER